MEQKAYKRKTYIVDNKFQMKYIFIILSVMLITVFAVSFTTFYIIWNNVIDSFFFVPEAAKKLGDIYVKTSQLLALPLVLLSGCAVAAGIIFSHRIAGPVYRVKKTAEEIAKGNLNVKVKFRKSDELQDLADSLNVMIGGVREIVREDAGLISKLTDISGRLEKGVKKGGGLKSGAGAGVKELNSLIKRLKKSSGRFKI